MSWLNMWKHSRSWLKTKKEELQAWPLTFPDPENGSAEKMEAKGKHPESAPALHSDGGKKEPQQTWQGDHGVPRLRAARRYSDLHRVGHPEQLFVSMCGEERTPTRRGAAGSGSSSWCRPKVCAQPLLAANAILPRAMLSSGMSEQRADLCVCVCKTHFRGVNILSFRLPKVILGRSPLARDKVKMAPQEACVIGEPMYAARARSHASIIRHVGALTD